MDSDTAAYWLGDLGSISWPHQVPLPCVWIGTRVLASQGPENSASRWHSTGAHSAGVSFFLISITTWTIEQKQHIHWIKWPPPVTHPKHTGLALAEWHEGITDVTLPSLNVPGGPECSLCFLLWGHIFFRPLLLLPHLLLASSFWLSCLPSSSPPTYWRWLEPCDTWRYGSWYIFFSVKQ